MPFGGAFFWPHPFVHTGGFNHSPSSSRLLHYHERPSAVQCTIVQTQTGENSQPLASGRSWSVNGCSLAYRSGRARLLCINSGGRWCRRRLLALSVCAKCRGCAWGGGWCWCPHNLDGRLSPPMLLSAAPSQTMIPIQSRLTLHQPDPVHCLSVI